ncbi:MAG: glycosyl-4,4-diaponeurosporenoate acyltransferase [Ilumatobacteraceae bacterium]|nr:glycosyl-4,4-diaponeurosporenoate acyltransferase [Ilumatobacteraceae bacterium]
MTLPLVEWSHPVTVVADVIAWGAIHAGTGYLAHRLPQRWCERDNAVFRIHRCERSGAAWRVLRVARWKDRLPEAGALFAGGVSKRSIPDTTDAGLRTFASLTRRAETAHWLAAVMSPVFVLWNPWWVAVIMVVYGFGVNAPFIAIQRYNRLRVVRVLDRRVSRSDSAARRPARSRSADDTTGSSIP